MAATLNVARSYAATIARPWGLSVGRLGARPEKKLEVFEFESCPFCRKVREALTQLDLEARIFPCPKRGKRFRPQLIERGGKRQFPYLIDPNTSTEMYESGDIVRYLYRHYGDGRVPLSLGLGPLSDMSASLPGLFPGRYGVFARSSRAPEQPLELWSFEASPYCRIVREALCQPRDSLPAAQRCQRKPQPRTLRRALRQNAGAVPRRSKHRSGDVRVQRHRRLPRAHLRGLIPERSW